MLTYNLYQCYTAQNPAVGADTILRFPATLMARGGRHSDTAAGLSQSPVSNALKIRADLHLNSATISRVGGRKLGRLKPNNSLSNIGGTMSVEST